MKTNPLTNVNIKNQVGPGPSKPQNNANYKNRVRQGVTKPKSVNREAPAAGAMPKFPPNQQILNRSSIGTSLTIILIKFSKTI